MNITSSQSEHHGHRRRSCGEVAELVAGFERSGLRRAEYCRQHGLSLASLHRYSRRITNEGIGRDDRTERVAVAASLLPIEVVDRRAEQEASQPALHVELSTGLRIGVVPGFDAATLQRLVVALREV